MRVEEGKWESVGRRRRDGRVGGDCWIPLLVPPTSPVLYFDEETRRKKRDDGEKEKHRLFRSLTSRCCLLYKVGGLRDIQWTTLSYPGTLLSLQNTLPLPLLLLISSPSPAVHTPPRNRGRR
jgi:hypothetical protein